MLDRYKALGLTEAGHTWKLFFKIFCFLQPELVDVESVEYGFLYEQASFSFFVTQCTSFGFTSTLSHRGFSFVLLLFRPAIQLSSASTPLQTLLCTS